MQDLWPKIGNFCEIILMKANSLAVTMTGFYSNLKQVYNAKSVPDSQLPASEKWICIFI